MGNLFYFYGEECHFCNQMKPLIEKLEKEYKLKLDRFEVWHNSKNAQLLKKYDEGQCGGVPFFFNIKTRKWICGAVPYNELVKWANVK